MMLIEVKEIHPPGAGKTMAHVIAMDGAKFEIGPEKLAGVQVGKAYECDVTDRVWNNRTIRKITKVTLVNGTAPSSSSALAAQPLSDGAAYVGHVIAAKILKGDMQDKDLVAFTARLRKIWRETDPEAQGYREAAE